MSLPKKQYSRIEQYLNNIATKTGELPPKPYSRVEQYLEYIAINGLGDLDTIVSKVVEVINAQGGSTHIHSNADILEKFKLIDGQLYFEDIKLSSSDIVFETIEG